MELFRIKLMEGAGQFYPKEWRVEFASIHGAPSSSKGVSVPRPTLTLAPSNASFDLLLHAQGQTSHAASIEHLGVTQLVHDRQGVTRACA